MHEASKNHIGPIVHSLNADFIGEDSPPEVGGGPRSRWRWSARALAVVRTGAGGGRAGRMVTLLVR